ncbi:MAG: hypothetical protein NC078_11045 [Ruminococcus sp.]|nr:hypothetical protein [Ruminococcus sp.]
MANEWIFPSNNFGTVTGIGEAGIETFKGSPYRSLAREICQNSMDARSDSDKPVIVEFKSFDIESSDIPGYDSLKEAVSACRSFWTENSNRKTVKFFSHAEEVINRDKVCVLRISDFNTTGLQGSDKEVNTPWQNLVKAAGVSDKNGSAGGSFGIGKSAPFACSELRTIFYATKDIDGLSAFQGIARLVSFKRKINTRDNDYIITTGTGYYSSDRRNSPVRRCISLDRDYSRNECGTDIFILGFGKDSDWKEEIITAVLEEFLMALYKGELIVRVEDNEVSSAGLAEITEKYKEKAKLAYNYYQVLTDENASTVTHEFPGLGSIELHVLIKQGLHRKVMMCRKNGMKVFDKSSISASIQFAGICILKDDSINSYFREMENPQHTAWEPERHAYSPKTKAKSNITMLNKFVKDFVIETGRNTPVDETDVEGMGEYFADAEYIQSGNEDKRDSVSSQTSGIEITASKPVKQTTAYEVIADSETVFGESTDTDGGMDDGYGGSGSKDSHDSGHNLSHQGTGFGSGEGENAGTNGTGDNRYSSEMGYDSDESKFSDIGTMSMRLFLSDKENNIYTIVFIPQKTAGQGFLKITLSGEQSSVRTAVTAAYDDLNGTPLRCKENKIYLAGIECKNKNKVSFQLEYEENCSLEVRLYGYSA